MEHNDQDRKFQFALLKTHARLLLIWETLWPLLVPLFLVVCGFLVFSWTGGWRIPQLSAFPALLFAARAGFVFAFLWSLYPLRLFKLPSDDAALRKIERESGLTDRPLTAQDDQPVSGGDEVFAGVLWREHQMRMRERLENMTAGQPHADGSRFDPVLLRSFLPLLVFAAFCVSFSPIGGRLSDVVLQNGSASDKPVRYDAWISPPDYTRTSPIFLSKQSGEISDGRAGVVTAPKGSELNLRFIGDGDFYVEITTAGDNQKIHSQTDEQQHREIKAVLEEDGLIRLVHRGSEIAQWAYGLAPDMPPTITFFEHPNGALSGSLQLTYTVQDDYGVREGQAIIEPQERQNENARPLVEPPRIALSMPRTRGKKAVSKATKDLTQHPLAGSEVTIMLEATDAAGQIGRSETRAITLPGRRFSDPLARALAEQRRILALDANKQQYVSDLLYAVANAANDHAENASASIALAVVYRRLVSARSDEQLYSVLDLYWEVALGIESGELSDLERRLRDAQENLAQALENGASDEEIQRLMKELREAMNEMIRALAQKSLDDPTSQNPFMQDNAQMLTQRDIDDMLNRLEDLARSGSRDAAQQLLSEMQRMMENLRAGNHQQQRQAEGNQLNQALNKLSELMQRQQDLMDQTYDMKRRENQMQNGQQQGQQQQGQQQGERQQGQTDGQEPMTSEELAEALEQLRQQQEGLQQQLGELQQQLEALGLGQSQEMGEAGQEMGEAGRSLGQGDSGSAAESQGRALEALRKGAQSMMQQMAGDRDQGGQQQGQQSEGDAAQGRRQASDPLGRNSGRDGSSFDSDIKIPGEIDAARAREILETIRERLSIPDNPLLEKEYLERLLNSE